MAFFPLQFHPVRICCQFVKNTKEKMPAPTRQCTGGVVILPVIGSCLWLKDILFNEHAPLTRYPLITGK